MLPARREKLAATTATPIREEHHSRKRPAPSLMHQRSTDSRDYASSETDQRAPAEDGSRCPFPIRKCQELQTLMCFGTLCNVPIQIRCDPHIPNGARRTSDYIALEIRAREGVEGFWVKFGQSELFACLAKKVTQGLKHLERVGFDCVQVEGIISTSALNEARNAWKQTGKSETSIDVNIYGHPHVAKSVGDSFIGDKLFLQSPTADLHALAYENPQCLPLPTLPEEYSINEVRGSGSGDASNPSLPESVEPDIDVILGQLQQPDFLREVSVDVHIRTALVRHQREALDFMNRRESGNLHPTMTLWRPQCSDNGFFFYQNVITGSKSSSMEDPIGGILADDMGLGKTLSTLALVVGSKAYAVAYALKGTMNDFESWHNNVPAKSTLVVVPSALLLDSWMEEIERHIAPGTVTAYRYHGTGRRVGITDLLSQDIVLSTYATIAAEFCRGQSMLSRIKWYRIVLDEAHTIRNTSTKQFRAIYSLQAYIRWCITGTPIQNSLDDLGALVRFLRTPILDEQTLFRKHITIPTHSLGHERFANIRRLLEALCLRRTKALLNLPEPVTETHTLELSDSERRDYHSFGQNCRRLIELAVSGRSQKKVSHYIIQAILGMRLFCNNGSLGLVGKCKANGLPSDPEEALSYLQARDESNCVQCGAEVPTVYQIEDPSSGVLTQCQHLICAACLPEVEADLDDRTENDRTCCPFCEFNAPRESFLVYPTEATPSVMEQSYPTKVLALVEEIRKQRIDDKSVVFSFWKKSLDVVGQALDEQGVSFFRIHGSLSTKQRAKVLVNFELSTSTKVLLITLGTGGVGINKLMSANHVHILEPQWNPSIENQAIGRILRLGQEKSVKIVRYIIKGTVEQAVQSRQLRKIQLAHGGFAASTDQIMNLICPSGENEQSVPGHGVLGQ